MMITIRLVLGISCFRTYSISEQVVLPPHSHDATSPSFPSVSFPSDSLFLTGIRGYQPEKISELKMLVGES